MGAVEEPADLLLVPLQRMDVESVRRIHVRELPVGVGVERPRHPVVHRTLGERARVPGEHLHDVDLAAGGPDAVLRIGGQHPEGGPQALPGGGVDARLDAAVGDVELSRGIDASGGVPAPIGGGLAPRGDGQVASRDGDVARLVALQLVVAPARDALGGAVAGLDVPLGRVERTAIELVRPGQLPSPSASGSPPARCCRPRGSLYCRRCRRRGTRSRAAPRTRRGPGRARSAGSGCGA